MEAVFQDIVDDTLEQAYAFQSAFDYQKTKYPIREDHKESLIAWRDKGRPLGGFLNAVVEGNLFEAYSRADGYNKLALPQIVYWIYDNMPIGSYGSEKIVKEWFNARHT